MTLTTPKRVPVDAGTDSVSIIDLAERAPTGPPVQAIAAWVGMVNAQPDLVAHHLYRGV
jgi:hypothetical protein